MAVSISISITQNSQSVSNNISNVTVKVNASWTYGSYNLLQKSGTLTVDGSVKSFTSAFNTGQTTSGSATLYSWTGNITHDSNGAKTLTCSASYTSGVSSGTVSASASKVLTTIPRISELGIPVNGILNHEHTLTVKRYDTSFTHSIFVTHGNTSTKFYQGSATTVKYTPPISWASESTSERLGVKFTIYTYNGGTLLGAKNYSYTYKIPATLVPSCSLSVSDPTGYADQYGAYIKGLSKVEASITPTPALGAPITKYEVSVDGLSYSGQTITTNVLNSVGQLTLNATVTDSRNRTGTDSATITVLDYVEPNITALSVGRCNSDGGANDQGEYIKVTFSATVSPLQNKNTANYSIQYKKSTDTDYQEFSLTDLKDMYSVSNYTYIFSADTSSSYDVVVVITDAINPTKRFTSASTAFTIMHFSSNGRAMGLGKMAELEDALDIGFKTKFTGGIQNEVLEKISDLNDVLTPNTYVSVNQGATSYTNCPITSGTFVLEVMSAGAEGQVFQRLTSTFKETHQTYERHYYQSTWGDWVCVHEDTGWLDLTLASGITKGSEYGYLKGRIKDGVLYIKGDVKGLSASWQAFATLPSALVPTGLGTNRSIAVYDMCYFCGITLNTNGALLVTYNSTGTWDATKLLTLNIAICL